MSSRIGLEYTVTLKSGEVVTIKSHSGPDIDETSASLLIEEAGSPDWIAARTNQGTVYLGVTPENAVGLAGIYDEHARRDKEGDKKHCSTTLVADTLGIENDPVLQQIVQYALQEDNKGTGREPTLARMMKDHRKLGLSDQEIVRWVHQGLRAWIKTQRQFIATHGLENWENMLKTEGGLFRFPVLDPHVNDHMWTMYGLQIYTEAEKRRAEARELVLRHSLEQDYGFVGRPRQGVIRVMIREDNPFVTDAAWELSDEGRADAILIVKTSGNFQVFANKRRGFTLIPTLELLTSAVLEAKNFFPDGLKSQEDKRAYIREKGLAVLGKQEWGDELYLWPEGPAIFNGSETGNVAPLAGTTIPVDTIRRILQRGLLEERRGSIRERRAVRQVPSKSASEPSAPTPPPAPSPEPSPEGEAPSPEGSA